jgi:hypothetical protein
VPLTAPGDVPGSFKRKVNAICKYRFDDGYYNSNSIFKPFHPLLVVLMIITFIVSIFRCMVFGLSCLFSGLLTMVISFAIQKKQHGDFRSGWPDGRRFGIWQYPYFKKLTPLKDQNQLVGYASAYW